MAAVPQQLMLSYGQTPVTTTYIGTASNNTTRTTYTFSSQSIGTANEARIVVICAMVRAGGTTVTLNSVSVQGISATQAINVRNNSSNTNIAAIYYVRVPTGTTGDVVLTCSGSAARAAIAVYSVTGFYNVFATASNTGTGTDPSATINVAALGSLIACGVTVAGTSCTWTGVTEDLDSIVGNLSFSTGHEDLALAQTGRTVTADFSTPSEESALAVISMARA